LKVAKRAEDTWAQKSGSSQDIALLYLAMLRAAGLTAYDMKVSIAVSASSIPATSISDQLDDDSFF
jgi:transglutaminase-like putative cysteine protease